MPKKSQLSVEACRGEYAKVRLQETDIQDAGILSIEEGTGFFICAIISKADLRKLRDKITEIINMPVIKL